ncbi:hypothetical protein, partial [Nocardia sp. MH4]
MNWADAGEIGSMETAGGPNAGPVTNGPDAAAASRVAEARTSPGVVGVGRPCLARTDPAPVDPEGRPARRPVPTGNRAVAALRPGPDPVP